ncbi:hypothetical protein Clacol_009223 [Clathrus columnatus]|uniref:SPX domain-containing protein n=1 Tax=Clathrus columnatus TaxID=1419009 RepID=A0AAV5AQI5_9AGAM|nr:hypothetical protein Clacol_009223 [Clathrus columnatus]
MHFSKTYTQLLLTLPEELRNNAIEYRRLKKLINQLVAELDSLGLSPDVLHELLQRNEAVGSQSDINKGKYRALGERPLKLTDIAFPALIHDPVSSSKAKVIYELSHAEEQGEVVPRLRLWIEETTVRGAVQGDLETEGKVDRHSLKSPKFQPSSINTWETPERSHAEVSNEETIALSSPIVQHRDDLLWSLHEHPSLKRSSSWIIGNEFNDVANDATGITCAQKNGKVNRELVISLASDTEFYRLLRSALNSLGLALANNQEDMTRSINDLSEVVSQTARPASAGGQSDLYTWRAIFQLYMEAEVFESTSEHNPGERTVEDSEARLAQFAQRVGNGGFKFKLKASREGLQRFLEFNVRLMNLKKFQKANAEAARKIMKKHAKRTALSIPNSDANNIIGLDLNKNHAPIPHILIVTLTESLLPIIPQIDDYLCLICTSIAFKPIRLNCGRKIPFFVPVAPLLLNISSDLFCVRCLVKMQKRGQDSCPMCRAPNVLAANKSNLDLAVVNLMYDWFPKETKEKAKANEEEVAKEEMEALGLDGRCVVF